MANLETLMKKIGKEITELKKAMAQKDEEIVGLKEENAGQKVQIEKLENNNRAMQRKMERILFCIPNAKKILIRRPMPAELLSEMFASLPMKNALDILAKMPNGLLARNIRKMLKSIEMAMRNNKWNEAQCGPKMGISEGGLVVKHSGPDRWNCVRTQMAIPKFNLNANKSTFAYFEVEIVAKQNSGGIQIGFCTQQFPLEGNSLGNVQNSIGIWHKGGMRIDEAVIEFENGGGYFEVNDMIGIGIVHSAMSMKCFATCNGNLLGKVDLPQKFAALKLFSAVSLYFQNDSIRANFDSAGFRYNLSEIFQNL